MDALKRVSTATLFVRPTPRGHSAAVSFESMAMAEIVLNVELRERTGTGGARETRRAGHVPGVVYGGGAEPLAISVKSNEFRKALLSGKLAGQQVTLSHGGKTQKVVAKEIQFHPVSDEPVHFDLLRVS
jgi:large subunit ribosomal protein L25